MQNKTYNTKALVEAGIMAAVLVVTMLISIYIPFISIIAYLALPITIALVYVRNSFKYAFASLICGSLVGLFIMGPIKALQLIIVSFFAGLTLGYCIKNNKKASKTLIHSSIAFFIVMIISLFVISLFIYPNGFIGFIDTIVKSFNESVNIYRTLYINMGVSREQIEKVFPSTMFINRNEILFIVPGTLILLSAMLAFLNYKLAEAIFSRLKISIDKIKGLTLFYIPNLMGAFLIVLVCIGLLFKSRNMIIGDYIFNSTWIVLVIVLSINGMAAVSYFLRNKLNFSNGFTIITIILLLLVLNYVFMIIGVVELVVDSRKLDPSRIRKIR